MNSSLPYWFLLGRWLRAEWRGSEIASAIGLNCAGKLKQIQVRDSTHEDISSVALWWLHFESL